VDTVGVVVMGDTVMITSGTYNLSSDNRSSTCVATPLQTFRSALPHKSRGWPVCSQQHTGWPVCSQQHTAQALAHEEVFAVVWGPTNKASRSAPASENLCNCQLQLLPTGDDVTCSCCQNQLPLLQHHCFHHA